MPSMEEHMGARIKARRDLLGLSVAALAKRSGLPLMRLEAYEAGLRRVVPGDLLRLCGALETGPATFLAGVPDPRDSAEDGEPDVPPDELRALA